MAIHKDLTGEKAIHQSAYVQSSDPGAVGALKTWYDTTSSPAVHKVRNATNDGWLTVGVAGGDLAAHLADTVDAHDASAISFIPAGTIAATDVQAAIVEVAAEAGTTVPSASETVQGKAELATQAETDTGTDDLRIVTPLKAAARYLAKAGGTLTGFLTLNADPTSALHAATKQYVDSTSSGAVPSASETVQGKAELATQAETDTGTDDLRIVTPLKAATRYLSKAGGTLTGFLTLNADPTSAMHAVTKQYADALVVGGGSGSTWEKQTGAGAIFLAMGDGDPTIVNFDTTLTATLTPTNITTSVGRLVRFRLPKTLAVDHVRLYTVGALTTTPTLGIYPASAGSSRLWQSGAFSTVAEGWVDITANTPFTIAANTDYYLVIGTTAVGSTITFRTLPAPGNAAVFSADSSPIGGKAIGIPSLAQIAVTTGAMPATLPTVSAIGYSSGGSVPYVFLEGTAS